MIISRNFYVKVIELYQTNWQHQHSEISQLAFSEGFEIGLKAASILMRHNLDYFKDTQSDEEMYERLIDGVAQAN